MLVPSLPDRYEVLCLQAADAGRGELFFGDSFARARRVVRPFLVGDSFPSIYLEFPLIGDPFLDVTVLYSKLSAGTRIDSPLAAGSDAIIDWQASAYDKESSISFGFEIDTSKPETQLAAVHFQPREKRSLVQPFCDCLGESERAKLYLELNERMPEGWGLSFFGFFRGRKDSPLRVCGYLGRRARECCAHNPSALAEAFDSIGFTAYDSKMLEQATELLAVAQHDVDFQFDVLPDGSFGPVFSWDFQFDVEKPEQVLVAMSQGAEAKVMQRLESWGAADERWKLVAQAAFARSIPVTLEDGSAGTCSFILMPGWIKARWKAGVLQPSKFYYFATSKVTQQE